MQMAPIGSLGVALLGGVALLKGMGSEVFFFFRFVTLLLDLFDAPLYFL
jgi:hypothetical protein